MKRSEMQKTIKATLRAYQEEFGNYLTGEISLGRLLEHLSEAALDCVEEHGMLPPYDAHTDDEQFGHTWENE